MPLFSCRNIENTVPPVGKVVGDAAHAEEEEAEFEHSRVLEKLIYY